jgi:hypothetical protein
MGAFPTIRLSDDLPAAPANGINVVFQEVPSVHNPTQANVSAALVGPGGTTDFLRADGTWAVPPGGGSGNFENMVVIPSPPSNGNPGAFTSWIQIPASALIHGNGSHLKVGVLLFSGTLTINKAVIRRAAAFGTSFIDSTPITWGGSASPTTSAAGVFLSDSISVTVDTNHDYWVFIYWDSSSTGNVGTNTGLGTETPDFIPGYQFGDQTTTAMSSLSSAAAYLKGIQQILVS